MVMIEYARNDATIGGCHAGVSISLVRLFWVAAKQGVAPVATYGLAAASIVMSLFLVYNLGAGGNPPQRDSPKVNDASGDPQAAVITA